MVARASRRRSRSWALVGRAVPVLLAAALLLTTAACGSARDEYVTNKEAGLFVKLPDGWSQVRITDPLLLGIDSRAMSPEMLLALNTRFWTMQIDASGSTEPTAALVPDADRPNGFVQVRYLLPEEANTISTNSLRDLLVPVDQAALAQEEKIRQDPVNARLQPEFLLLVDEPVQQEGGVHGVHLVYQIRTATGLVTIDQTSLLDQDQTVLYQLVLACTALCYLQNGGEIAGVQKSFTVKPVDD